MSGSYDPQEKLEQFRSDIELPQAGDVPGDTTLSRFPLSTHDGIVAAWSYINNPDNADRFDQYEVEQFKQRVRMAARQKNVDLGNA